MQSDEKLITFGNKLLGLHPLLKYEKDKKIDFALAT